MGVFAHVCLCVCRPYGYVCVCLSVCVFVCPHVCTYICVSTRYVPTCLCTCVSTVLCSCAHVCVRVCACVSTSLCVGAHVSVGETWLSPFWEVGPTTGSRGSRGVLSGACGYHAAAAAPCLSGCLAPVSPAPGSWPSQASSEVGGSTEHGHGGDQQEHLGDNPL